MSQRLLAFVALLAAFLSPGVAAVAEDWGAPESFAVVNPVVRSPYADAISLAGKWDFSAANAIFQRLALPKDDHLWGPQALVGARQIDVPGIWEAQGVGEPGPGKTWDCLWDCGHWDLQNQYSGIALYRKYVDVPERWRGKRVWLKIGGAASQAYVWVNRGQAAFYDAYCGARKYDVTSLVTPGEKAEILAILRNDVPARIGLFDVNEHFGGFYRDVELEATPNLYIDDVWARGDLKRNRVDVRVYLKSTSPDGKALPIYDEELDLIERERLESLRATCATQNESSKFKIDGVGAIELTIKTLEGDVVATVEKKNPATPIGDFGLPKPFVLSATIPNLRAWTPESPNLYLADVVLKDDKGVVLHGWTERFGVRDLKVVGKTFELNGRPYFMRGGGDHNYDQINLIEPPDRDRFREHMAIYKEAGFNYMRHHTHSPLPEYFEAAEEAGILLQPELPYYHDVPCEGFEFNPRRELWELFRTNRRYVSFATYSFGNEGFLGEPLDQKMYQWIKKYDPDRLVVHQDGGVRNVPGVNSDFATSGPRGEMIIQPWQAGAFDDHKAPFLAHEYLNLAIKMDPRLEPRFTGVRTPPVSVAKWREKLERLGLNEDWGGRCVAASEVLQGIYQKRGLESARLDSSCDGYMFWSLVDASIPQGSCIAAQGYLNPFWEPRPNGVAPKDFYRFNGPTALLKTDELAAPILVAGDAFAVTMKISHYDAFPLENATLDWRLVGKKTARVYDSGALDSINLPAGFAGPLGDVQVKTPTDVDAPEELEFQVSLRDSEISNSWKYWIFPKRVRPSLKACAVSKTLRDRFAELYDDVAPIPSETDAQVASPNVWIVSPTDLEFYQGLKLGKRLVAIEKASEQPNVALGWWALGTQVGAAIADSPAFDAFPTDRAMNELWFRIVRVGAANLETAPLGDKFEPLFLGEGRDDYFLYAGQTKFNDAKILATFALDLVQNDAPEATALLDSLLAYAQSDRFDPQTSTSSLRAPRAVVPEGVVWGFDKIVDAPNDDSTFWKTLYEDSVASPTCRQTEIGRKIVWQTAQFDPAAQGETTTFEFVGALGYWSETKSNGFQLSVNGVPTLVFDLPESDSLQPGDKTEWRSDDGASTLAFEIGRVSSPGPDYFGVFKLTVPTKSLDPKKSEALLEVQSKSEQSRRWFSVNEYRGEMVFETLNAQRPNQPSTR